MTMVLFSALRLAFICQYMIVETMYGFELMNAPMAVLNTKVVTLKWMYGVSWVKIACWYVFIFEMNWNIRHYLGMLRLSALPQINEHNVIFQQDSTPARCAYHIRDFFHEIFPQRLIGQGGWNQWPPRSQSSTPMSFLFLRLSETRSEH